MVNKKTVNKSSTPEPLNSILFVSQEEITLISPESITVEFVGEKAFGLSCLPKLWTQPFVVVSDKLLSLYRNCTSENSNQLIKHWSEQIIEAVQSVGINNQDNIIVRSSGCSEGLKERGKYYSSEGKLENLINPLTDCLERLSHDTNLITQKVPLIIQKLISPISSKGHLSNERRCYEDKRDWLCEFEELKTDRIKIFPINIRNWRQKILVDEFTDKVLMCNLSAHVSEVLKIAASWAYEKKLRLHYEWVWDGNTIYLVQADQEHAVNGVNPTKIYQSKSTKQHVFIPKCLKQINEQHAKRYNKIRNVFTYIKLGLPNAKLYALDNQSVINDLALGKVASELEEDIKELVKGSLVIRMDIATEELNRRQLLPRTQEVRDLDHALKWLKEESANIQHTKMQDDLVFIFHNFVQANSSAFAYSAPGERKVQIEALWGLPEGLYYNAHDKYIVDTKTPRVEELNYNCINRFEIWKKRNFKRYFVAPNENGQWTSKVLMPPYDWQGTIKKEEWIREIAFESRRIAEEEGKALSIMWFIDVSNECCPKKVLPWYHEHYDPRKTSRSLTHRSKTPFDKSLVIRTNDDIEKLRQEATIKPSSVRRIRIQPQDDKLLRNKNTLREIGELSKKIDAVILLEGGVLSHAYYQLMETDAIVEVLHPFENIENKREFNKLVRDKVVLNIEHGGEVVDWTKLSGEHLLRALKEKLIEESFEVLDAIDQDSIVDEMADVSEVIDEILSRLGISREKLQQRQNQKREKAGGFKDGTVLLETQNPLPTKKEVKIGKSLFDGFDIPDIRAHTPLDGRMVIELGHKIDKSSDRREHEAATEVLFRMMIPTVRDDWIASTPETTFDLDSERGVRSKITGKRLGAKIQIELSVFIQRKPKQLKLFDYEHIQRVGGDTNGD